MKLKNMSFTKKTLVDACACQEAIDFCERNGLFCNVPIKNLEIIGKYKGWVEWLRFKLNMDYEYDSSDRLGYTPDDINVTIKTIYDGPMWYSQIVFVLHNRVHGDVKSNPNEIKIPRRTEMHRDFLYPLLEQEDTIKEINDLQAEIVKLQTKLQKITKEALR